MATLDNFMNKARELADSVGKVTGELVDDSRLKIQEIKLNSELKDAYERLGTVVYDGIKSGARNQALVDLVVSEIDGIRRDLDSLKVKAPESSERYCPQCGATNVKEAVYCCKCGAPLSAPAAQAPEEDEDRPGEGPGAPGEGE